MLIFQGGTFFKWVEKIQQPAPHGFFWCVERHLFGKELEKMQDHVKLTDDSLVLISEDFCGFFGVRLNRHVIHKVALEPKNFVQKWDGFALIVFSCSPTFGQISSPKFQSRLQPVRNRPFFNTYPSRTPNKKNRLCLDNSCGWFKRRKLCNEALRRRM